MKRLESSSRDDTLEASGRDALIEGILEQARREVGEIEEKARKTEEDRMNAARKQAEAVGKEADIRIEEQLKVIERESASSVSIEIHRMRLRNRDRIVQDALGAVLRRFEGLVGEKRYREILLGWIAEGMIGLGAEKAKINASAEEMRMIDGSLLEAAEEKVRSLTGRRVRVEKSDDAPLLPRGVILEASGGRLIYNNQIPTRMLRYQSEIRKLITEALFSEEGGEPPSPGSNDSPGER